MNSSFFRLPFTPDLPGFVGFIVSVALAVWIANKVPVLKRAV